MNSARIWKLDWIAKNQPVYQMGLIYFFPL